MAAPVVISIDPTSGPSAGGTTVLIAGTDLEAVTAVRFGTVSARSYVVHSSTLVAATSPAHAAGEVRVSVVNADGASTDEVSYTYTGGPVLFTLQEARAFDRGQLANASIYSDAAITAKENEIRTRFERVIGVSLLPTTVTEYCDGTDASVLYLRHHNPFAEDDPRALEVESVTVVADDYTEDLTTDVVCYPGKLVLRYGVFPRGQRNVVVTYTHGYVSVPDDLKYAALQALVLPQPDGLIPNAAPSAAYEGEEGGIRWSRVKDPGRGRWFGHENVDAVLREHRAIEVSEGIA